MLAITLTKRKDDNMTVPLQEIALHVPERRKLERITQLMADGDESEAREMARKWCRSSHRRQSRRLEALANVDGFEKSEILSQPKRHSSSHWLVDVCRQTRDGFKTETTCYREKDAINIAMRLRKNEPDAMIRVTEVKGVVWRNF